MQGGGGGRGLTVMPLEDNWLGLSPGGWERGEHLGLALQIPPDSEPGGSSPSLYGQGRPWTLNAGSGVP